MATDYGSQPPPIAVQGGDLDFTLGWFGSRAHLSQADEPSAHVAPGYPWLYQSISRFDLPEQTVASVVRWLQCGLGVLAVGCFFFFARRAFHSSLVAFLTGILTAVHPFWVANTAELTDGVLATFLLAIALALGTRGAQAGGAFTSLLYGLSLAVLAMVRAAMLPFALIGLLWFLWRCRSLKLGWFCGFLAVLGFGNGLAPWTVRNFIEFGEPIPVADSAFLHLWMGNNRAATGAELDEIGIRQSLGQQRTDELLAEPNQAKRYASLGRDLISELRANPTEVFRWRLQAGQAFFVGGTWATHQKLARDDPTLLQARMPYWLGDHAETIMQGSLLAILLLALLGWRLSFASRREGCLATIAVVCVPLPYLLSHAEALSGPRLPLDGVFLCYGAYALACLWPGFRGEAHDAERS